MDKAIQVKSIPFKRMSIAEASNSFFLVHWMVNLKSILRVSISSSNIIVETVASIPFRDMHLQHEITLTKIIYHYHQ